MQLDSPNATSGNHCAFNLTIVAFSLSGDQICLNGSVCHNTVPAISGCQFWRTQFAIMSRNRFQDASFWPQQRKELTMIPTINQIMKCYRIVAQTERMKTGRPGEATVANALNGAAKVCQAAGIEATQHITALTS